MSSITFDQLAQKFKLLPDQAKKEAYDFIEMLLRSRKPRKKKVDKEAILLGMSYWDNQSIERLDDVRKHMNQWEPETF